jgi:hypothetical protein
VKCLRKADDTIFRHAGPRGVVWHVKV